MTEVIELGSGNLLLQDTDALVNTVNTVGVMGKGIALQFKRAFPGNYAAYRNAASDGGLRIGEMFVFDTGWLGPRRYIINFPTKQHWRSRSRIEDVRNGLVDLVRHVRALEITSIAVPALGCGNGGLAWADVRPLIEEAFAPLPDVRVVLFAPTGAPAASEMPAATKRPRLTSNRAALLLALDRYLPQARSLSSRNGVSELETQKIAYFLQILGQPAKLRFVRGRYGPYAEQLNHVLLEMESHFTIGYGDRSARVTDLAPIDLTDGTADAVSAWLDKNDFGERRRVDRLMKLVDGFETPYSMELLATTHFAAHQEPANASADIVSQRVERWNLRKARLFTSAHVAVAVEQLRDHGLVEAAT